MRSRLKRILNPETRLRERIFQLLSAIALVEFVVVFIYYLAYGNDKIQTIILFVGMILFAGTVLAAVKGEKKLG